MNRRVIAGAAVGTAALVAVVFALTSGGDDYVVYAKFKQAGGLREGFKVRVGGAPVGSIKSLTLDEQDRVVAKLSLEKSAAPVGKDARVTSRAADLLGEKFIDLAPGNEDDPLPSGSDIPTTRTALAVELDDVINALDLPTRTALRVFLNEQGRWFVGRHEDIATSLASLPPALDRSGALLDEFASDNEALGRLVEESDRVVAAVAREHDDLGEMVEGAAGTFDTIGKREADLAATVNEAPGALRAAQGALVALESAAPPLVPAARGLAETAPQLTRTLLELPGFTANARPALRTIRRVSPTLTTLGRRGTPVVRRLRPLTRELITFSSEFAPVSKTLDTGIGDFLGVLEGWARSTQGKDQASHIFRFGLTVSDATFASLVPVFKFSGKRGGGDRTRERVPAAGPAPPRRGDKPGTGPADTPQRAPSVLPKGLLPPAAAKPIDDLLNQLGVGGPKQAPDSDPTQLLDFLLGS